MASLHSYATYVPLGRLGPDSGVRGRRPVASFDEDSTTMGVEAAAVALADRTDDVGALTFVTSTPAYLDKSNASTIHAALRLDPSVPAADAIGTARSFAHAVRGAVVSGGVVVAADVRVGKPGSADERGGADAAVALVFAEGPGIADVVGQAASTAELLDRWRGPGDLTGQQWEERFGFDVYAALARETAARAVESAGLAEADHVVVTSSNAVLVKRAQSLVKGSVSTTVAPLGFSGAADPGLALASVLDRAEPGQSILVLSVSDGCDAFVLRTTELLRQRRPTRSLEQQAAGGRDVRYLTYLSWRGLVERELPRRPEPDRPAGPPSFRGASWKFALTGSRCTACGFVHLPSMRVCRECGTTDQMEPVHAAGLQGTVATYTVDRLAYSPSPPVVDVVVDLDGGGRCTLEVADADPDAIDVGTRVGVSFRSLFTAGQVHNYFWKARVLAPAITQEDR